MAYPAGMRPAPPDIASEIARARNEMLGAAVVSLAAGSYFGGVAASVAGASSGVATFVLTAAAVGMAGARSAYRKLFGAAAWTINTSFNDIGLGKLREASRKLDAAEARPVFTWVARLVDIQRAIIAMRQGDLAESERRLDAAIARPLGLAARANSLYQIEGAYALRAFVRASLGDGEGARRDIAEGRGRTAASPDALARVALAEAILHERAGERGMLKELLDREEALLIEHTHPRERAIVRAYQRMLRASERRSVYRHASSPEPAREEADEPELVDWVATIAPSAAPFVRAPRRAHVASPEAVLTGDAMPLPKPDAVRAVAAAHTDRVAKRRGRAWPWVEGALAAVGLVGAVAVLLRMLWPLKAPGSTVSVSALSTVTGMDLAVVALFLGVFGIAGGVVVGNLRSKRPSVFRPVTLASYTGGVRATGSPFLIGDSRLLELTASPSDVTAAQAWLMLAGSAERRSDFAGARRACEEGLARLTDARTRAAADILYPDLIALRAFLLALQSRSDEADAELALLGPTYPHHARAVFRVRLVGLLRRGEYAAAARWVEAGAADLPLSVREELLADLTRAALAPGQAGAGEIERLKDELRRSQERRRWVDLAAPGLVEAFERCGEADDRQAREEVAAEEEAARELEGARAAGCRRA